MSCAARQGNDEPTWRLIRACLWGGLIPHSEYNCFIGSYKGLRLYFGRLNRYGSGRLSARIAPATSSSNSHLHKTVGAAERGRERNRSIFPSNLRPERLYRILGRPDCEARGSKPYRLNWIQDRPLPAVLLESQRHVQGVPSEGHLPGIGKSLCASGNARNGFPMIFAEPPSALWCGRRDAFYGNEADGLKTEPSIAALRSSVKRIALKC